jgi:hypothetical protein
VIDCTGELKSKRSGHDKRRYHRKPYNSRPDPIPSIFPISTENNQSIVKTDDSKCVKKNGSSKRLDEHGTRKAGRPRRTGLTVMFSA